MTQFRIVFGVAALLALAACVAAPILLVAGETNEEGFKGAFLGATVAWFVCAWFWSRAESPEKADD
ncbi:MAG TPA: hypothetical protein VF190_07925 [Rhodothermales bacterium]